MARFHLTEEARRDLVDITVHTEERWGEAQSVKYTSALFDRFQWLADHPSYGRACDDLLPGLRRVAEGSHVVYYRQVGRATEVVRVLHKSMLPALHLK